MALTGIGGSFSKSGSGFSNEQGVSSGNRALAFGQLFPGIGVAQAEGLNQLQQVRAPQLSVDQFGLFRSPNFNSQAFIQQLLGDALSSTAANATARGQVNPENLANIARGATQRVATGLLPLTQQNILQAQTIPSQFGLERGQVLLNPAFQGGTALATGGGSGQGSSSSISVSGNAGFGG